MFHQMIDDIFKDLLNIFGLADNILIIHYDVNRRNHDKILRWVMQLCQYEKLNWIKMSFQMCKGTIFFG